MMELVEWVGHAFVAVIGQTLGMIAGLALLLTLFVIAPAVAVIELVALVTLPFSRARAKQISLLPVRIAARVVRLAERPVGRAHDFIMAITPRS
jgi:hypothetical protein